MATTEIQLTPRDMQSIVLKSADDLRPLLAGSRYDINELGAQVFSACMKNPALKQCDKVSLLLAVRQAAELGLNVSGTTQEAFLVPYQNKVQLQIGVDGLVLKVMEADADILRVDTQLVYDGDEFVVSLGSGDPVVVHNPAYIDNSDETVTHVYAVIRFRDGGAPRVEVMSRADIDKVKACSKSGNVWKSWYGEKARVAVLRRALKRLPKITPKIKLALDVNNEEFDVETPAAPMHRAPRMPQPKNAATKMNGREMADAIYAPVDEHPGADEGTPADDGTTSAPPDTNDAQGTQPAGLYIVGIADPIHGEKKGADGKIKKWTKYILEFSDGRKLSTFSGSIYEAAVSAHTNGNAVEIQTETKGQYENLVSLQVIA